MARHAPAAAGDTEAEELLDQLVEHRVLGGPELDFLRARLAHQRGDAAAAGAFMKAALDRLPGHQEMLDFAVSINAPLPTHAQKIFKERSTDRSASGPTARR